MPNSGAKKVKPHTPENNPKQNILAKLLTKKSRVLFEKLTGLQPVKKFPAFY
jgi:hypothetical protein